MPGQPEVARRYARDSLDRWEFEPQQVAGRPVEGEVTLGDLVVVEVSYVQDKLVPGRIVERFCPAKPKVSRRSVVEDPSGETERFVWRGVGRALEARARAFGLVRSFFDRRGFVEVDTPSMVPCPGLDLHLDAYGVAESPHWLITSPEYQMKRLLVGGIPRCYQLARCYRRGEVGGRHNPEFLMLEWYRAFASVDVVMDDTEELVRLVITGLSGKTEVVVEGVVVESEAVLGAGVILTASTPIVDVRGDEPVITKGRVPARAVVIPGSLPKQFPAGTFSVPCALLIAERSPSTDRKTSLNEVLRTFQVQV